MANFVRNFSRYWCKISIQLGTQNLKFSSTLCQFFSKARKWILYLSSGIHNKGVLKSGKISRTVFELGTWSVHPEQQPKQELTSFMSSTYVELKARNCNGPHIYIVVGHYFIQPWNVKINNADVTNMRIALFKCFALLLANDKILQINSPEFSNLIDIYCTSK